LGPFTTLTAFVIAAIGGALFAQSEIAASAAPHGTPGHGLIEVQYRSYLEGRDFQSYRQERGFVGERRFDSMPDRGSVGRDGPSPDPDRPTRLQRRFYGAGDSACAQWSRRCDRRWGSGNPDYYGCMRYHGCR